MGDPFGLIGRWFMNLLTGWGMGSQAALTLLRFLGAAVMAIVLLFACFFLIVAERKILGRFQDRYGPNRIGPFGIFQTIADFVKLLGKEIGTMGVAGIVEAQDKAWFIVAAPLAALVYLISSIAENGRAPFDLMEGESEIVAGFNIEYGGLAFGMFYVGEFLHAFTVGVLFSTLYLGGWRGPGAEQYPLLGLVYLFLKTVVVWFVTVWIRGSFPRVRIDQLLGLNWKFLTPLALLIVAVTAVVDKLAVEQGWNHILALVAANVVMAVGVWTALGLHGRSVRQRGEKLRATAAVSAGTAR
jgi:NADH:ubiquinone oxidoreductase subunit H